MPLKYKKLVVLFSLGIMLIGFVTFSLVSPDFHLNFLNAKSESKHAEGATFGAIKAVDGKSQADVQTELEELIRRYFQAKQQVDMDTIAECVSHVKHVEERKLLAEAAYVEAYENIQCLVMNGVTEGAYRVYVYYDVKFYDIDTLIPSLNALYIKQDEAGAFQIYLGSLNSQEQKYIDQLDQSERVRELVSSVQSQLEAVVSSDSDVRELYEMLESARADGAETDSGSHK